MPVHSGSAQTRFWLWPLPRLGSFDGKPTAPIVALVEGVCDVKGDLIEGTSATLGVISANDNRAVRRFVVRGLWQSKGVGEEGPGDFLCAKVRLANAISCVQQALAVGQHPFISPLPLSRIRGRLWGRDKAIVDAIYERRTGVVGDGELLTVAKFRSGYEPVEVYSSLKTQEFDIGITNQPKSVEIYNTSDDRLADPDKRPEPWIWNRPVTRILVPTVINTNPTAGLRPLLGTVNQNDLSLGGYTLLPGTTRFDGTDVDWRIRTDINGNQTLEFIVQYQFTQVAGRWEREEVEYDGANWIIIRHEQYARVNWNPALFPAGS